MSAPWKPNRRKVIAEKVRDLRKQRGYTQAELAAKLGISQARLSQIENGEGSLSAEQFLELLQIFNVSIQTFTTGKRDAQGDIQNALARHGANHLYEDPELLPSENLDATETTVREALLSAQNPRVITSLAPVLVFNHSALNLPRLWARFADYGLQNRLGWALDNTLQAIRVVAPDLTSLEQRPLRRAEAAFANFLAHKNPTHAEIPERGLEELLDFDHFDSLHLSTKTLVRVLEKASPVSIHWWIATTIQVQDFAEALKAAISLSPRRKHRHDSI